MTKFKFLLIIQPEAKKVIIVKTTTSIYQDNIRYKTIELINAKFNHLSVKTIGSRGLEHSKAFIEIFYDSNSRESAIAISTALREEFRTTPIAVLKCEFI